jgi:hypothetical protein
VVGDLPILFSAASVRGLLDGRKTETRRPVKPVPSLVEPGDAEPLRAQLSDGHSGWGLYLSDAEYPEEGSEFRRCPYGRRGTKLWVRETFIAGKGVGGYAPGADPDSDPEAPTVDVIYRADDGPNERSAGPWKPGIHMPRRASRLLLEVTDVRVERLNAITEEDAIREGAFFTKYPDHENQVSADGGRTWGIVRTPSNGWSMFPNTSSDQCLGTARFAFANAWIKMYGEGEGSYYGDSEFAWNRNPLVWVVSFRCLETTRSSA